MKHHFIENKFIIFPKKRYEYSSGWHWLSPLTRQTNIIFYLQKNKLKMVRETIYRMKYCCYRFQIYRNSVLSSYQTTLVWTLEASKDRIIWRFICDSWGIGYLSYICDNEMNLRIRCMSLHFDTAACVSRRMVSSMDPKRDSLLQSCMHTSVLPHYRLPSLRCG